MHSLSRPSAGGDSTGVVVRGVAMSVLGGAFVVAGSINMASGGNEGLGMGLLLLGTMVGALGISVAHRG